MLPTFDLTAFFWIFVGGSILLLAILIGDRLYHRILRISRALWYLTYWMAGAGIVCQIIGVYYEIYFSRGEGVMMLVVGAAFLSLAGLFAQAASKKQQETESEKQTKKILQELRKKGTTTREKQRG